MSSLRFRLMIVVFLAIMPMAALIAYHDLEERQQASLNSERELLRVVQNCDSDYRNIIEQTKQLLAALAEFPAVKNYDTIAATELFAKVLRQDSLYLNIMATRGDGQIFASAKPLPPHVPPNLSDRLYFQRILETRQFSQGEMVFGRALGVATLPVAYPLLDPSGRVQGVVAAGLNLGRISRIFQIQELSPESSFAIIDNRGRIMFQHPDPGKWIGKDLSHTEIIQKILAEKQGPIKARDVYGQERLYAYLPLGGNPEAGFAFAGIPLQTILAPARLAFIRNLTSLGLATFLALTLAWLLGLLFVIRRMNILTNTTKKLAAGDLSARTGFDYGIGEIDQLARAFDEMANTLQQRESERQQSEKELRQSEEKYRLLVNQVPAVVYKGYLDWSLDCYDDKIEKVTGYSKEEFNSRRVTWLDLIFPEEIQEARKRFAEAQLTDRFCVNEYRIRKKNGEVCWIQVRNQIITDPATQTDYISGVFFDITDRKLLEDQLLQAQKMEAVGLLAGGIAHDFNNLLSAIMGYSEIMLLDLRKDNPLYQCAEEIMKATDQGASLTNKLLAFSRKQILQPRLIDFNGIVTDMDKMLRRLIGEDIDLVTHCAEKLDLVKADPGQVEQILMNLAVNARDAMPLGGKLTIETANVSLDESYAQNHAEVSPGPYVMLAVTDNGAGMDGERLKHIFEPFFTTKEMGKGTGLGLAMVYGIVKQSGGHIWVYSEPGRGTTFKVYFPRAAEGSAAVAPRPAGKPRPPAMGGETILLVEDDSALKGVIAKGLQRYGYEVWEAANGQEALAISAREKGPIHLLLTDVVMPQMGGRELAERLALLRPEIKVIYMSGYTTNAVVHHGVLDAGLNFIQKPVKILSLIHKVREVLEADEPS
ncbi:MAG: ATP-binding protein [Thermodesulfobacteriota bacterium]